MLVALAFFVISADARAFCRAVAAKNPSVSPDGCPVGGPPIYWKSACVGYHVNQAGSRQFSFDEASALIQRAFLAWTSPGQVCFPSIQVVALAPTANAQVGYDHENIFVFRDDGIPGFESSTLLEVTTSTFNNETGEILDFDVEINTQLPFIVADPEDGGDADGGGTLAYDLRFVMTHAAGHVLGLAHSGDPDAVLFASTDPGIKTPPYVKADDATGICAIYPLGGRTTLDGSGNQIFVPASACDLSSPPNNCGPAAVDHGCSMAPRGTPSSRFAVIAVLALVYAFALRLRPQPEPP